MILQHRLKSESQTTPEIQVIRDYGDLPPVKCYAGQLNQVLMNILSNAIDAIEEAGRNRSGIKPTIRIHTETLNREECDAADISDESNVSSERSTTHIAIRIIDNGSGMSEAVCQRVFDPFFTTKPVGKGTGLGMSISHQIVVERHGGAISCVSKQGEGTEFIIELPLQPGIRTTPTPSLQSTL
jgi:signal transduction histidine kinase